MGDTALVKDQTFGSPDAPAIKGVNYNTIRPKVAAAKTSEDLGQLLKKLEMLVMDSPNHSLRMSCAATCMLLLLLVGSMGPILNPAAYGLLHGNARLSVAGALHYSRPLPQMSLAVLLAMSFAATCYMVSITSEASPIIKRKLSGAIKSGSAPKTTTHVAATATAAAAAATTTGAVMAAKAAAPAPAAALPAGGLGADKDALAVVTPKSVGSKGGPLGSLLKLDKSAITTKTPGALPEGYTMGPGGVLVSPEGRALPRGVTLGPNGVLLAANGEPLPSNMKIGPNGTLLAIDGTVLGPDLLPVPGGFTLSPRGRLLRPNGKAVPPGAYVGKDFVLTTPFGEPLPEGIKVGPNSSILTPEGDILGADGYPAPKGYTLSKDRRQLVGPSGLPIGEDLILGPNGTLISDNGVLLADVEGASAPLRLRRDLFGLSPLGNLMLKGTLMPHTAKFTNRGTLVDVVEGSSTQLYPLNKSV